jgi:hypothetical protein
MVGVRIPRPFSVGEIELPFVEFDAAGRQPNAGSVVYRHLTQPIEFLPLIKS